MYPCSYNNLPYCFKKRTLPKLGPITPEIREKIDAIAERLYKQIEPQLQILDEMTRITHKDLSITINSPEPKYKS